MLNDNSRYFSISELLGMNLPGYPDTRQGWHERVKREKWELREVKGLGGPGGVRREYSPPPDVRALIAARQRGELPPAQKDLPAGKLPLRANDVSLAMYRVAGQNSDLCGEIDGLVLSGCLSACSAVYGAEFDQAGAAQQIGYAVDLYNLLVRMCHSQGVAIVDMKRLEVKGLAEQLGAFIKLGWAKKFPPPVGYSF